MEKQNLKKVLMAFISACSFMPICAQTGNFSFLQVNNGAQSDAAVLATGNENNKLIVRSELTQPGFCESFRLLHQFESNRNNGYISFHRGGDTYGGFLEFGSNGLERMRIDGNGNVGIGTTPINYKLDVNGIINTNSDMQLGSSQDNSYLRMNTKSRSWWAGVGVISGDNRFVIYDATSTNYGLTIGTDGNVGIGIGTAQAAYKLDVNGAMHVSNGIMLGSAFAPDPAFINNGRNYISFSHPGVSEDFIGYRNNTFFLKDSPGGGDTSQPNLIVGGKMGVNLNSDTPQSELDVNGTIRAKEVIVTETGWSDFVFDKNYKLRDLKEVDQYIQENGHLPDIPSAAEVKENGVNLVEVQAKLLQKVEEMTLYILKQQKEIKELKEIVEELKSNN